MVTHKPVRVSMDLSVGSLTVQMGTGQHSCKLDPNQVMSDVNGDQDLLKQVLETWNAGTKEPEQTFYLTEYDDSDMEEEDWT